MTVENNSLRQVGYHQTIALASVFLCAPFVYFIYNRTDKNTLTVENEQFIEYYLRLGLRISALIVIGAVLSLIEIVSVQSMRISLSYNTLFIVGSILMLWSTYGILESETAIFTKDFFRKTFKNPLIISYIPVYSLYVRYTKKFPEENKKERQENIVITYVISLLLTFIPIPLFQGVCLFFLIRRMSMQYLGFTTIPESLIKKIHKIEVTHVEELFVGQAVPESESPTNQQSTIAFIETLIVLGIILLYGVFLGIQYINILSLILLLGSIMLTLYRIKKRLCSYQPLLHTLYTLIKRKGK